MNFHSLRISTNTGPVYTSCSMIWPLPPFCMHFIPCPQCLFYYIFIHLEYIKNFSSCLAFYRLFLHSGKFVPPLHKTLGIWKAASKIAQNDCSSLVSWHLWSSLTYWIVLTLLPTGYCNLIVWSDAGSKRHCNWSISILYFSIWGIILRLLK